MADGSFYDIAIIGGGINGAAIARDASLRGLRVILLEQEDFASGASSKTSKLAHGGLRYLETFQFRLVKECLEERSLLFQNTYPLTRPLPFILPVYEGSNHPLWMLRLGLFLYDKLDRYRNTPPHQALSSAEILKHFPTLSPDGLKGGFIYYDGFMEDSRIVLANALSAQHAGARIENHTKVLSMQMKDKEHLALSFIKVITGEMGHVLCRKIVNATGAWSNEILKMDSSDVPYHVSPSKGVHVVIPGVHAKFAMTLTAPQDQRVFFLVPWNQTTILGTTDTPYEGNPSCVEATAEDVSYLLDAYHYYFPKTNQENTKVIASYAGLRPLVKFKSNKNPSRRSRDFIIEHSSTGIYTLLGGKYTTHRKMAEDVVNQICKDLNIKKPTLTTDLPLPERLPAESSLFSSAEMEKLALDFELPTSVIQHLVYTYGKMCHKILERVIDQPDERHQVCPHHPHIQAELHYCLLHEKVQTLSDWFCRRTSIAYTPCLGLSCLGLTSELIGRYLQWTPHQIESAKRMWVEHVEKEQKIIQEGVYQTTSL